MNKDITPNLDETLFVNETETLGQLFQRIRQSRHLSLEDVHKQIQLRPTILQQLEADQFHMPHSTPSFVKGYIRCYAKFLGIPESAYHQVIQSLVDENIVMPRNKGYQDLNDELHRSHWATFAILLVVFTLLAVTVLWWWENHQQENAIRDERVSQYSAESTQNRAGDSLGVLPLTIDAGKASNSSL